MAELTISATKARIDQLRTSVGFEIIKPLQENERFLVYLVRHEGEKRVFKIACNEELEANLERDVRMSMFLTTLGMKLLGYLHDTADYIEKCEETGEPLPYSTGEMREVLDAYLKFNVTGLV